MWAQVLVAALGVWLTAAPAALEFGRPAATNAWVLGPVVASLAAIAACGAMRPVRWANVPAGLWLAAAPLVLPHPPQAAVNTVVCGLAVAALSSLGGRVSRNFGGGWAALWRRPAAPATGRA